MKPEHFLKKIKSILEVSLPKGAEMIKAGRILAEDVSIGRTAFMDKMGVDSEAEYKLQCIRNRTLTFHAHIGMNSWNDTAIALNTIYEAAKEQGFTVDRAGICLDRRMGLTPELRKDAPSETGPMLDSDNDWASIGQVAPIQPHMGDFMIGFPASVENTLNALRAGVTSIGNLSQFFSHEVPNWKDHVTTTAKTVQAIAIMGSLRPKGTLLHSYLEDGYGALFYDCATVAGWAFLEKYIVEDLMGAKLSHCIGGLTTDPVKRAGWVFALDQIHDHNCLGTMIYGDTISFSDNLTVNVGLVSEYLTWDIMAQLQCPTGHALVPLPLTEGIRIPSAQEIIEAQTLGRRIQQTACRLFPHIDFSPSYDFANNVVSNGKVVFNKALDGLKEAGVDIRDPVQLLFVLKKLGPSLFEEMFGAGKINENCIRGRELVIMTDVFTMSQQSIKQHRQTFLAPENRNLLCGRKLLIASTDVHEHAILILQQLCAEAGAEVLYLGAERNPEEVIAAANAFDSDVILLSTHNGMALEYAKRLQRVMKQNHRMFPIIIGGVLNQKVPGKALPVDVTTKLLSLGLYPYARLKGHLPNITGLKKHHADCKIPLQT
jgi:hypothetical protein